MSERLTRVESWWTSGASGLELALPGAVDGPHGTGNASDVEVLGRGAERGKRQGFSLLVRTLAQLSRARALLSYGWVGFFYKSNNVKSM
jgi:hypothetical protein